MARLVMYLVTRPPARGVPALGRTRSAPIHLREAPNNIPGPDLSKVEVMYQAEISRANPTAIVFLIDQSSSMSDHIGAGEQAGPKADVVADALNRLLAELTVRCAEEENVRDYFHIGVIGYGGTVDSAFTGTLTGKGLIPLSEVAENPSRVEDRSRKVSDGAGGLVEQTVKFPVWLDPQANGGTPMTHALTRAKATISDFIDTHPDSFPPIVMNLTDGESTDGDPTAAAQALRQLSTSDGNTLLFNLHVSSSNAPPIVYPGNDAGLPDQFARMLFGSSSPLTATMAQYASDAGYNVAEGARGFVFNADISAIVQFLDIGTRVPLR